MKAHPVMSCGFIVAASLALWVLLIAAGLVLAHV